MNFELNDTEKETLNKWLKARPRKLLLERGARLILEFGASTGIGRYCFAKLIDEDSKELVTTDITDYLAW